MFVQTGQPIHKQSIGATSGTIERTLRQFSVFYRRTHFRWTTGHENNSPSSCRLFQLGLNPDRPGTAIPPTQRKISYRKSSLVANLAKTFPPDSISPSPPTPSVCPQPVIGAALDGCLQRNRGDGRLKIKRRRRLGGCPANTRRLRAPSPQDSGRRLKLSHALTPFASV